MKKALMIASMASMLDNFNRNNIELLLSMGYSVTLAANFDSEEDSSPKRHIEQFEKDMTEKGCHIVQIDFSRQLFSIKKQEHSYKQIKKLVEQKYDLVHCHSPICAALTRFAFRNERKSGTRVIYTAHGFHFFMGAPLKNWLLYFPAEWIGSHWTDELLVINKEDYRLAKRYMKSTHTVYIPGVGIDTNKYHKCIVDKSVKCRELGIPENKFILLSVGELQARKNQRIVIEALHQLNNLDILYLMVGQGELQEEYTMLIDKYSLNDNIKLLGFRTDIAELCKTADCFIHPSVREGLGIAPLEAMACGLPLITSDVNGIKDYAVDGVSGYCVNPHSAEKMAEAIDKMMKDDNFRRKCGMNNIETANRFDISKSAQIMQNVYSKGL